MYLVIQGPQVETPDLKRLAKLSGSGRIEQIRPNVFRLADARPHPDIAPHCAEAGLDFGFVPEHQRLEHIGLVALDMDSTLIAIECLDEMADLMNIRPRIAAITDAAMRGEIDFAQSLAHRVGLFAGLDQRVLQRVYDERLKLSPGAERLIGTLHAHGIKTLLASGNDAYFTNRLKNQLDLDFVASNRFEIVDGKLTGRLLEPILDAHGKAQRLCQARDALGLASTQVLAIGDGANDLDMLAAAGIGIAYRAKSALRARATYTIDHNGLDAVLNLFI